MERRSQASGAEADVTVRGCTPGPGLVLGAPVALAAALPCARSASVCSSTEWGRLLIAAPVEARDLQVPR